MLGLGSPVWHCVPPTDCQALSARGSGRREATTADPGVPRRAAAPAGPSLRSFRCDHRPSRPSAVRVPWRATSLVSWPSMASRSASGCRLALSSGRRRRHRQAQQRGTVLTRLAAQDPAIGIAAQRSGSRGSRRVASRQGDTANIDDETPSSAGGLVVSTAAPSFGAAQTELRTRVSSRATAVTWRKSLPQQPPTTASAGSRLASRT